MTERDIAAEVLRGLQEVREHRTGKRTLREARIDPTPIPELNPSMVARVRESLEGSESAVSAALQESVAQDHDTVRNDRVYGFHVVAFIDLLGQRARLERLQGLEPTANRSDPRWQALDEGAHQIQLLRDAFIQALDEAKKPPSADVPEADRERLHGLRKFKHSLQVFSDCIAISVPLHQEPSSSLAVAATGLFATLYSVAAVMLTGLCHGIPARAGIDVGPGLTGALGEEVYGPVFLNAYKLESTKAEYPRAVVGQGLLDYLDALARLQNEPDRDGALAGRRALDCKNKLLCAAPDDGLTMLHYLSPLVAVEPRRARAWVHEQCRSYRKNHDHKLETRYRRLLEYFDRYK